jgi:hypothetical protein
MSKTRTAVLAALLGLVSSPSYAAIACSNSDITVGSGGATDCAGFYPGNIINDQDANEAIMASALAGLGFTYTGDSNGIEQFNGGSLVNFITPLVGETIIGVHFGNGVGSPGRPDNSTQGDGGDTAFYLFDAGASLDSFLINFNSVSTVTLFQTGSTAVPEPGTWAMMLIGFGAVGVAMRRRRQNEPALRQVA